MPICNGDEKLDSMLVMLPVITYGYMHNFFATSLLTVIVFHNWVYCLDSEIYNFHQSPSISWPKVAEEISLELLNLPLGIEEVLGKGFKVTKQFCQKFIQSGFSLLQNHVFCLSLSAIFKFFGVCFTYPYFAFDFSLFLGFCKWGHF